MRRVFFSFESSTGAKLDCSLIPGSGSQALVIWAPFSDGSPNSSAEDIYRYVSGEEISKFNAAPHSWNQLTKSGVTAELLKQVGREMPVLTVFSPMPSLPWNKAYTSAEYKDIRRGDYEAAARIVAEAVGAAQTLLHGDTSETQLDTLHFHGASLGASKVIGAASGIMFDPEGKRTVESVTAQELITGSRTVLFDLAARFTIRNTIGEPSSIKPNNGEPVISEPMIRQKIDGNGAELMMFGRMLQGMSKLSQLKGLTRPDSSAVPEQVERLNNSGVNVLIPLAENSGLTYDTPDYLPGNGERVIKIRAVEGQRAAHLIDEHVALTALLAAYNIRRSK